MQNDTSRGKMVTVRDGYALCPHCRHKLIQVRPETSARNLIVFCRCCRTEIKVNIEKSQCFESQC